MTKSIDKSVEEIFALSKNTVFTEKVEEVKEELTADEQRKHDIAIAIEEARAAKKLELEQEAIEEAKLHKSEDATTSAEKETEIVEKNVKNKIEINPDIKESIVGKIYAMYNNKYLSEKKAKKDYDGDGKVESGSKEHAGVVHNAIQKKKGGKQDGKDTRSEAYTVTNADKKGNTPAYQGLKSGKKSKVDGKPMYKAADHMKEDENYGYDKKGNSLNPKDKKKAKKKL